MTSLERGSILQFSSVTELLFSWGGSYTWISTGPTAEPHVMPLPLPSTIAGALGALAGGPAPDCERVDLPVLVKIIERILGPGFAIKGPIAFYGEDLYALSGPRLVRLSAIHNGLKNTRLYNLLLETGMVSKRGVALSYTTKTAVEHMLYSVRYTGLTVRSESSTNGDEVKVQVDILDSSLTCNNNKIPVQLGGDRGMALLECINVDFTSEAAKGKTLTHMVIESAEYLVETVKDEIFVSERVGLEISIPLYVVSPAVLLPAEAQSLIYNGTINSESTSGSVARLKHMILRKLKSKDDNIIVKDLSINSVSRLEAASILLGEENNQSCTDLMAKLDMDETLERLAKNAEPRLSLLALGFDMKAARLRPIYPAIMPGSIIVFRIRIEGVDAEQIEDTIRDVVETIYVAGIAPTEEAARLGWGTIVPLKRRVLPAKNYSRGECVFKQRNVIVVNDAG